MLRKKPKARTASNTVGHFKISSSSPKGNYEREDFYRDLKKVVKKLSSDHPSRSDSRKR